MRRRSARGRRGDGALGCLSVATTLLVLLAVLDGGRGPMVWAAVLSALILAAAVVLVALAPKLEELERRRRP